MSSPSALAPGRGSTPVMHWCHECGIEIRPLMTPGPTCPRCNGQFVEEIDPANPIARDDDIDEDDEQIIQAPRPFAGAERGEIQEDERFAQPGLDLGSLVGNVLRGLASAGSQPRPAEYERSSRSRGSENTQGEQGGSNGSFRTGTSQMGPVSFSWGMSSFSTSTNGRENASGSSSSGSRAQRSDVPFAGRAPLGLNEFLRQSFEPNEHHHDDGMGGAGGAADGRFFNADNRGTNGRSGEGRIAEIDDEVDDDQEPDTNGHSPETTTIRDLFVNLFGGLGDGPAGTLLDMFGGGGGSGRSGDYVWGQRGLDDVITQLMEQTRGSTAPPPASEEAIKRLDRFSRKNIAKVRQARNRECSTCMDSFEDEVEGGESIEPGPSMDSNRLSSTYKDAKREVDDDDPPEVIPTEEQQDELMMMPCKHLFHLDCLLPWLQTNGTCPVCRVSLATDKDKKKDKETSAERGSNLQGDNESSSSGPTSTTSATAMTAAIDLEDEDESPEAIRLKSRHAAEARMAGSSAATSSEPRQTVPGGYHLQPDELD